MISFASSFSTPSSFFLPSSRIMAFGVALMANTTEDAAPAMPSPTRISGECFFAPVQSAFASVLSFILKSPFKKI